MARNYLEPMTGRLPYRPIRLACSGRAQPRIDYSKPGMVTVYLRGKILQRFTGSYSMDCLAAFAAGWNGESADRAASRKIASLQRPIEA